MVGEGADLQEMEERQLMPADRNSFLKREIKAILLDIFTKWGTYYSRVTSQFLCRWRICYMSANS